jgi:hypothetical protein
MGRKTNSSISVKSTSLVKISNFVTQHDRICVETVLLLLLLLLLFFAFVRQVSDEICHHEFRRKVSQI